MWKQTNLKENKIFKDGTPLGPMKPYPGTCTILGREKGDLVKIDKLAGEPRVLISRPIPVKFIKDCWSKNSNFDTNPPPSPLVFAVLKILYNK